MLTFILNALLVLVVAAECIGLLFMGLLLPAERNPDGWQWLVAPDPEEQ